MTAHELVAQWFQRPQTGVESNRRYVTIPQVDLLRLLCEQDEEGARAIHGGTGRSFTWMPSGRDKYVVTEGREGRKNTIVRLGNVLPSASGTLFGKEAAEEPPEQDAGIALRSSHV